MGLLLKDGYWYMKFQIKGAKVYESCRTGNRRDAERIMAVRHADLFQKMIVEKKNPVRLHVAIDEFKKSRRHLDSFPNIRQRLECFLSLPNVDLDKVTDLQLVEVVEGMIADELALSTVAMSVGYFNAMIDYCAGKGYSVREKFSTDRIKGYRKGRIRWMTKEELTAFFKAVDKQGIADNSDFVRCLYYTCSRYSEVAMMKWQQVDFDANTVTMHRGKGSRDSTITMPAALREILETRMMLGSGEYVFPSKTDLDRRSLRWVLKAVKAAKLSTTDGTVTLHTIRHTAAVHLLKGGLNLVEVQHMLGHRNIQSTMVYVHITAHETTKKAAGILDAALV